MATKIKNHNYIYFQIKPFKDNEFGISNRDIIIRNLTSLKRNVVSFMISGNIDNIKLFVKIPKNAKTYFENTFYANFNTSDLIERNHRTKIWWISLQNIKPISFIHYKGKEPILSKEYFTKDWKYIDPMRDLFALFTNIPSSVDLILFFDFKFAKLIKLDSLLRNKKTNINQKKSDDNQSKDNARVEVFVSLWFFIRSQDKYIAESIRQNIKSAFSAFAPGNKIKLKNKLKFFDLNISQAVNFFHIPTKENFIKWLDYNVYRKLPYPTNIPTIKNTEKSDLTILGKSDYRWETVEFGIKKEDKFRHIYIVGKTGTWKSTFMSNMVRSDMHAGNGLCLLDPHWDLVDTVIEHIPKHRINDVILFDISDSEFPIGFNLLQYENEDEKVRIVSGVVSTFYRLFEHSRWPRLEYILRNVLLTIVDYPNATLMHILRILTDKDFRQEVLTHVTDPVILKFRRSEFDKRQDRQREEAIWPITNKIWQFLSSKVVRNIFGQPRTKLNLRKAMDEWKIILINLSKWKIGEDNASMIGSLLVTKLQIDAMSRADIPYSQRKDFYLYIDEFQNFATKSFSTILSEARKYKLSLIVANQFTAQLLDEVKDAIFGNVGTIISFTLWHDDATIISNQYKELVSTNDLISLPRFTAYSKLMVDGVTSDPFSMKTKPLPSPEESIVLIEKIRKQSRQRYAMERGKLERLLEVRWKKSFTLQEKIAEKAKLEWLWVTEQEFRNLQHPTVQTNQFLFTEYAIWKEEPDAIIFDIKYLNHKAVWYKSPEMINDEAIKKFSRWTSIPRENSATVNIYTDIYQHKILKTEKSVLMLRIWSKEDCFKQLKEWYAWADFLLFCPNIEKLSKKQWISLKTEKNNQTNQKIDENALPTESAHKKSSTQFTINDIKKNERYQWYVKLKYNYGIFVTVKWVEWLLHKNFIVAPDNIERKQYYNIWDKIRVKAMDFKDIKGEKRVVRGQR